MKVATQFISAWALLLVLGLGAPQLAQAQDACGRSVRVQLFPLDDLALERTIETNLSQALSALNMSDATGMPEGAQNVMTGVGGSFCTLRTSYNALLIPHKTEDDTYEIRGIHLVNRQASGGNPQLRVAFNGNGDIIQAEVIDDNRRAQDRENLRASLGSIPRGTEVLDILVALEAAYNLPTRQEIAQELTRVLTEADIEVSKLRNGQASTRVSDAETYVGRLDRIMSGGVTPNVTYEMINIYPSREESDQFRVTLVQHWMYPPPEYLDSDYLALDVKLLDEADVTLRRAGRGGFSVVSFPHSVSIDALNDKAVDLATPHTFMNEPVQFHYIDVGGGWYEMESNGGRATGVALPTNVVQRDTIFLFLRHKPAQLVLHPIPEDATLFINGVPHAGFEPGEVILIPPDVLFPNGDPGPDDPRRVTIRLERVDYEDFEQEVIFPSPEPHTVNVEMTPKKGTLMVSSVPPASAVLLDGAPLGETDLTTELDATGVNPPYIVVVRNDECLPTSMESDCAYHVPSLPQEVVIESGTPTNLSIALVPFLVRNLTNDATIEAQLERDGDMVMVDYDLENVAGKDRKYRTSFGYLMPDGSRIETLDYACSDSMVECLGNVRPGSYGYAWNISELPEGARPIMVLKRKRARWPWILLPAAAGVAAAYLFPRDGSGGGTFIPPPRPDGN